MKKDLTSINVFIFGTLELDKRYVLILSLHCNGILEMEKQIKFFVCVLHLVSW